MPVAATAPTAASGPRLERTAQPRGYRNAPLCRLFCHYPRCLLQRPGVVDQPPQAFALSGSAAPRVACAGLPSMGQAPHLAALRHVVLTATPV